jgi:curved DNA-binding protein CbpA
MATQTLYEILEVRQTASQETIRAAWERLSAQWDPSRPHNNDPAARTRYAAMRDAYLTLTNAEKRRAYDRRLRAVSRAPVQKKFGAVPKLAMVLLAALAIGGYNHSGKRDAPRYGSENAVAAANDASAKRAESEAGVQFAHVEQSSSARRDQPDTRSGDPRVKSVVTAASRSAETVMGSNSEHERGVARAAVVQHAHGGASDVATAHKAVTRREQGERAEALVLKPDTNLPSSVSSRTARPM